MANMLSGSALMDGAILLVAANEKVPQAQSKEHLLALQTLGITQIVVVQNKVDLVSYKDALSNYSCLLYTSPSPRDQRGSRMPSSA